MTPGAADYIVRAVGEDDAGSARALIALACRATPFADGMAHAIEVAVAGRGGNEYRALVAHSDGTLGAVIAFGSVAGAVGTGEIYGVATGGNARRKGLARLLVARATAQLRRDGARLVVAEVPDEPAMAGGLALLQSAGFELEGTIPDYFRDGVGLRLARLALVADDVSNATGRMAGHRA